jgi:hypothetical protein
MDTMTLTPIIEIKIQEKITNVFSIALEVKMRSSQHAGRLDL